MKKSELKQIIREEIKRTLKENKKPFKAFGGVHSDAQLDSLNKDLKIYKSKDPKDWQEYIAGLKKKGYDKAAHKEHPHYEWAMKKLNQLKGLSKNVYSSFKQDFDKLVTNAGVSFKDGVITVYLDTDPNRERNLINKLVRDKYSNSLKKVPSELDVMKFKILSEKYL